MGVAFDPNFAVNSYVYVYYTTAGAPIHNRVSRFRANGDVAVSGSEVAILDLEGLGATNHNGGAIHFGPDGKLYVAVGENANAPNAQSFANRLGKILRINGDGSIPVDNPFAAQSTGLNQAIWAMGLQNPYTFAFHPANGRMNINDVGKYTWEEVNEGIGGSNYGWPTYEGLDGRQRRLPRSADCVPSQRGDPIGCAITGGAFLTASGYPGQYSNAYFYADFCSQWIYYLPAPAYNTATPFVTGLGKSAVDLHVRDGELYYLTRDAGGTVFKITYSTPRPGLRFVPVTPCRW